MLSENPDVQLGNDEGTAGVIARPPVLFLTALLLGRALDHFLPLPVSVATAGPVAWVIGGLLALVGLTFASAGIRNFSRAATPVPTTQPVRALVTTGIHGRTRNPIYVGMFLLYAGIGIAGRSPWTLLLELPVAITMRYGVVAREESYLDRRFGDVYRDYKTRVPRWL